MDQYTINLLNKYDTNITKLDISNKNICGVLDLKQFPYLQELNCCDNEITSLDNMPSSLIELYCSRNQITSLNNLPSSLITLDCSYNFR